jgi:hypothetical protein
VHRSLSPRAVFLDTEGPCAVLGSAPRESVTAESALIALEARK